MMHKDVQEAISDWVLRGGASLDIVADFALIDYLSSALYKQFLPATAHLDFGLRLRDWLANHPIEQRRQTMLKLVPFLAFYGAAEMNLLRREGVLAALPRFLTDSFVLDLTTDSLGDEVSSLLSQTLFIGLTKSSGLYEFCKVNGIAQSINLHADTMAASGITPREKQFVGSFKSLVLVEDFVGTGSQSGPVVEFICNEFSEMPILCMPLICCPSGFASGQQLCANYSNLTFAPVLSLASSGFVKPGALLGEVPIASEMRDLIVSLSAEVAGYAEISVAPFGFEDTGALAILYNNCPDNVLELIHLDGAGAWAPLFPRVIT
jgi:hypothetical protein